MQHKAKDALFNHTVDLIAGILFLLLAAVVATWALRVKQLPHIEPKPPKENSHLSGYFTIGISSAVIGFTTLPIMYLVGRVTASLSSHWGPRIIAYAVFLVALAAPFFALAWVWRRFPRLSDRITEFYTRALSWDYRWLAACASALVGLALLWFAFFYHR